jgi:hypothetical protein
MISKPDDKAAVDRAMDRRGQDENLVDLVSEASFPASDAPPWTFGRKRNRDVVRKASPDGSPDKTG